MKLNKPNWYFYVFFFFFKILFIFKERDKEKKGNIDVWETINQLPLTDSLPGTWSAMQACALTQTRTHDLLVCKRSLDPLSHSNQGTSLFFYVVMFLGHLGVTCLGHFLWNLEFILELESTYGFYSAI